jgi:hypothetical protein
MILDFNVCNVVHLSLSKNLGGVVARVAFVVGSRCCLYSTREKERGGVQEVSYVLFCL